MSLIEKGDLQYDYQWTSHPGENPMHEGSPDSNLFNREEGYEVLELINEYAERTDIEDKEKALEIERHLHESLGRDVTTQRSVMEWLDEIFGSED